MNILGLNVTRAGASTPLRSIADDPAFIAAMEQRSVSPENPSYSLGDPAILSALGIGDDLRTSPAVSPNRAMQTAAVYACVRILAESLAQLPAKVFEEDASGNMHEVKEHPMSAILSEAPNSYQDDFQFREMGQAHCALWGNFYNEIQKNRYGDIVGLYPLKPWETTPKLVKLEKQYTTNGVTLYDDEVLHIHALGWDGICGMSPVALHRTTIGMTLAAEEFGAGFYRNGTKLAGVLQHPQKLSPEASARLRDNFGSIHSGPANTSKVAVLEEGMTFKEVMMPLEDAQYIESRKFQVTDIARIYRVPPHMVADLEKATFSNIEQQGIEFVVHTMMPWVRRWESSMRRKCFRDRGKRQLYARFNLAGLLRGDIKSRYEAYNIGRNGGWLSANDILRLENMNPVKNGDIYLEPLNMKPAGSPDPAPAKKEPEDGN